MLPITPLLAERFWAKVEPEPTSGCWLWVGASDRSGYGRIGLPRTKTPRGNWAIALAHRVSYELHRGPIRDGMDLDHLCRLPACVNPWHLEPVTHRENCARGRRPYANRSVCKQGHSLDGVTYDKHGRWRQRFCRQCHLAANRRYYDRTIKKRP